jgi:hypothetical protein
VEGPAERTEADESDFKADVGHTVVRFAEQEHRSLNPAALQVAVRRLPERGPERPDEVSI